MKKLTLFLVAMFAMVNIANAQRAWAYDLGLSPSGDSYEFTFKAVTAANATLVFYQDGIEVGTLDLGAVAAGQNTVTKTSDELLSTIQKSGDFTWGVKMMGSAIASFVELTKDSNTDFHFWMPTGVAVDNNPESPYFSRFYIASPRSGKMTEGGGSGIQHNAGVYVFDQTLTLLNETKQTGYVPSNVTVSGSDYFELHRIAVNPTNNQVAFSQKTASIAAIWSMNPASMKSAAENLISGTAITDANSCCFDKDGVLYVANTSTNSIYKVKDGVATIFVTTSELAQPRNAIASDGRGGLWIAQYRGQDITVDGTARLMHIDSEGTLDYKVDSDTPHDFTGTAQRGAVAYNIKEDILAFGANKYGNLYKVTYDAETGDPSLESIGKTPSIATNIDGLAFDYAGDLYITTASIERLFKYAVPTNNNTCTTPAPKAQAITLVAPSIALNAHPVKDYSASIVGAMKRAIQNGENTIILTHEANGTAHIYNIAHATKTITEISQEGVIAVDPDNAGDYLAISDIALSEDGKLIASNYMRCEQGTTPATGYKVGEIRYYIWNDITAAPTRWFTTNRTANSTYADVSYTFAIKGTSTNAQLMSTAVHNNNRAARINLHTVVNGTESAYHRFGLHTTASEYTEAKQGVNFQLTATPLDNIWTLEGELTDVTSFAVPATTGDPYTGTALKNTDLGKKYNGVSYLANYHGRHLMVAPNADEGGKLAGVKVLDITNGFAAAIQITTSTDLTSAISATAAAATAYVDGDGDLTIYLFADSKVYAFSEKEYSAATYTVTATANEGGSVEGGGTYDEGATATLTATPAEHYEFTGWTGDVTSTDNPLIVEVNSDMNITANFAKKQYTLTVFVNDEDKGTIDVATGSYEYGTEVTLTATPKEGYKLLAWSNKATTPSITLTMDNNKAVSAYFVKEYATDPTFTIEKVWENTNVPAATANGFQGVGWDQKIYIKDRGNNQILSLDATESSIYATLETSSDDQPIAVDEAGNLIVRSGSTLFYNAPTQVRIFRKGETTSKVIDFTLPATGRCDFITASGDIFSEKGGYVYFFCQYQTTVSRLFIKNGEYVGVDAVGTVGTAAASQSNVVLDIYGNIHTQSKNAGAYEYNITTLTSTADPYLAKKNSTIGGCTFELGGKEFWAYVAGTTNYSSEWQLINATDGKLVSEEILFAKDKTSQNSAANWLNAQVIDEKTALIYQFCPTVAAAVWKVSFKENYTVSASATNGTVTGAGTYQEGATATLTATPNTGYKFVNWTTGGVEVSTEATYSFHVTENVELVANFEAIASKDPRAWAYDMKLGEDGDDYTFTFKATTAGQATITFKDKDGNALAQPESQTMTAGAGENKFTIAKNAFAAGVDAFWSITMDGAPIDGVVEVTDQSRGIYDFYNMMGVVVDNNTDSKDFGKIYVQSSLNGKSGGITDRAKAQKAGIFIYNQDLDELNNPSNVGYKPTVPNGYDEIGSSYSTFQRLNIDPKTGNLVFSYAIEGNPAVFAINREDMTGDVTNLLTGVADMTRSVAHCFDVDGTLFVMNFADNKGTVYKVINGEATKFTETSGRFINANITIASDGRGGFWVSQNRGQIDYYYQLAHVTSEGAIDWSVYDDRGTYVAPQGDNPGKLGTSSLGWLGSSSRGALAYDAERNILAQGRNGKVELYSVSYEPTITLTPLHTIASNDLGTNIDGLAFDYAGDLYVVNSSKEKFQKFTLPTAENICTVAAPALEAVRFTPVYTVSVASNNNEWGIANGGGTFEEGETATITAVAATNYKFVNWTKGSTEVSTDAEYTFNVTETATYTANFVEKTKYTIDVIIVEDAKMGTVTGVGSYYEGTEVTLTAKANGGYVFVKWSDEVTDESRTFTASENVTLQAIFKVATPRAWAYDLKKGEDSYNYTFTFTATSDGNATILFTDKDGNAVAPTQEVVGAVTAGETKTVSIAKTQFTGDKDIYWSVKVAGDPITKMAEITDPTKGIYDIVAPQGIAVDNNTDSKHFGQVYVAAATDGSVSRGAQTRGIFVYDPILNELNSPNAGYLPANAATAMTDKTRQAIHRVAVNPTNGQVAFAYNLSGSTAVWAMNPEKLADNAINLIESAGLSKVNSLCFDESGALYVMENANVSTGGKIYRIQDGVADVFANVQAGYNWVTEENTIVSDGRGGLWIAQNRWQVDLYPALSHVDKNGNVDFAVTSSSPEALKALFPHDDNNASYRGQCAYYVAEDILAFGGNKEAVLFKVTYDANNAPTNLEKLMSTGKLGTNIDGLAFDYAGDLYVASETTHRMYKFVIPTNDNTCTVPAPESQIIMKEARYTVTVVADPAEMGTVTEGGEYKEGEKVTLTATANADYRFINWTIGSDEISKDASFEYTVLPENVTITAHFELKPLAMVGVVKRAVQIGESTVVLTHETNGTPHLYKVVDGELEAEISQEGVIARDPDNAGDYLSISDIAATEDGKLVACNYILCQSPDGNGNDNVDANYKKGESRFYIWSNLTSNPTIWFTSKMSSNWFRSKQGYTMAVKGTSSNATVFVTGMNLTNGKSRYSIYTIKDGTYNGDVSNNNEYYHFTKKDAITPSTLGDNYELNASPLGTDTWILDGGLVDPFEITDPLVYNTEVTVGATINENLGKKFNGATYLTVEGTHLMVAPYAVSENVGGVTVLNISNGFNNASELNYHELGSPEAATAAATAVKVNGDDLFVTLVTDNKVHTFTIDLDLIYTRTVTSGRYGTICLPYGSTNMTGATFYEVAWMNTAVNPWQVYVDEVTELEAGKPYIFMATSDLIKVLYQGEEALSAGDHNGLYGTFTNIEDGAAGAAGNVLEGNHMLSNNEIKKCLGNCKLQAYRAYFKLDEISTVEPALMPGRRRVALGVQGGNEATGVDNLTEDGVVTAIEGTYDVLGRKMNEPNNTGFYIVNGKKVVIVK